MKINIGQCSVLLVLAAMAVSSLSAASDPLSKSPWLWVGATSSDIEKPKLGDSYLTASLVTAKIYKKSNWYVKAFNKDWQTVITVNLAGRIRGVDYSDSRISPPQPTSKTDGWQDFPYAQPSAIYLPTNYDGLVMKVSVKRAAQDGLSGLLTSLSDLSAKTPALAVSQTIWGGATAVTQIADFIADRKLVTELGWTQMDFPTSGDGTKAGYWACLAGDTATAYQQYQLNVDKLQWNDAGKILTYEGKPIDVGVSYFIVRVSYASKQYDSVTAALSGRYPKPWAALYQMAQRKLANIRTVKDSEAARGEALTILDSALEMLYADPDLIQRERDFIDSNIKAGLEEEFGVRVAKLYKAENGTEKFKLAQSAQESGNSPPANVPRIPTMVLAKQPDDVASSGSKRSDAEILAEVKNLLKVAESIKFPTVSPIEASAAKVIRDTNPVQLQKNLLKRSLHW